MVCGGGNEKKTSKYKSLQKNIRSATGKH